jgi:hypothetical protein
MKWIKLTVLSSILFAFLLHLTSCESDEELKKTYLYQRTNLPLTGAQETPPVNTPGSGTMDVSYNKTTRMLNYTVRWTGLTGNPISMHIHGLDPMGFTHPSNIVQTILSAPNATLFPANGTFTGVLMADGVVVKEDNILNGFYTTANPGGEIRGQIVFQ